MRELSNEEMIDVSGGNQMCWHSGPDGVIGAPHGGTVATFGGSMPWGIWECNDGIWFFVSY